MNTVSVYMDRELAALLAMVIVMPMFAAAQTERDSMVAIQQAMETGDLDGAGKLLSDSLAQHPRNGGLMNLRGVLHARKGEMAEARKDFGEAVRLTPELTAAWQNLGRACAQLDKVACATEAWRRVLRAKPGDGEAHESLAVIYAKQAKFAESLSELNAGKVDDLALRCTNLTELRRIAEAKTTAAKLAQQVDFSEAELETMHGAFDSPKGAGVLALLIEELDARGGAGLTSLRRLVLAYEQLQRPAEARKTLERVAKLDPENTAHLLELARLAETSKDFEGALGYLAHARDLDPNSARIHFLFGSIANELNLPIEAKASLEKALAMEPDNPSYNFAMGSVILKTRDAATAASYFERYVKARPADGRGHYALGLAHFASGDYKKAKDQMKVAEGDSVLGAAAEYYLGRMARLEGDLEESRRRMYKSIERMATLSEPHTELGRLAMLEGNLEEAHRELTRALQLSPDSFQANEQLLVLYKRTHDARAGKQEEALKKLDQERSRRAELMLRTIEVQR